MSTSLQAKPAVRLEEVINDQLQASWIIPAADSRAIYDLIHPRHHAMVRGLWEVDRLPLASMKLENELDKVVGITFTFAGFRYDRRRRRSGIMAICQRAGVPDAGERIMRASDAVEAALGLLSVPVEVVGVDVSASEVRQIKAYIRMNVAHERIFGQVMTGDPSNQEDERKAVAAVVGAIAPSEIDRALSILDRLQLTRGALEGVGVDLFGDQAEFKFYFLPRRIEGRNAPFSDVETIEFVDAALEMFDLREHSDRAHVLVRELRNLGLRCSFLAVEMKPDGSHEMKVDYNTVNEVSAGERAADRFVSAEVAGAAMRSVFKAAQMPIDEDAFAMLLSRIRPGGIKLDDFTADLAKTASSGKAYVRAMNDLGAGVYAAGA